MTFVPAGGLANRIRALSSAIALAGKTGTELKVLWFRDWALHAAFRDLFVPSPLPPHVRIVEASWPDLLLFDRPRRRNFHLPAAFQKLRFKSCLYEHEIDALRNRNFDFAEWAAQGNVYMASYLPFFPYPPCLLHNLFTPVPEIGRKVEEIYSRFSSHTVGVHVRRTDNVMSIEHSPLELFFERLDREQKEHDDLRIYLATDSEEVKEQMKERYRGQLVCLPRKADRGTTEGIRDGIMEMILLSRTVKIYGSYHSSFSELAAELGSVPLSVVQK